MLLYTHNYACVAICVLILLYMCPHSIICVLILYMCPHTTAYVSSCYNMCPHTTKCVLILLYMSSYYCASSYYYIRVLILLCVFIRSHTCKGPHICCNRAATELQHATTYVCSHDLIRVQGHIYAATELQQSCNMLLRMCAHTTSYVYRAIDIPGFGVWQC
jgi:hypothetical protein